MLFNHNWTLKFPVGLRLAESAGFKYWLEAEASLTSLVFGAPKGGEVSSVPPLLVKLFSLVFYDFNFSAIASSILFSFMASVALYELVLLDFQI